MPYKDPARKKERKKEWDREKISQGYGRWLYARRKLRFDDEERFRETLEKIASLGGEAGEIASNALAASQSAEDALGRFSPEGEEEDVQLAAPA